MQNIGDYWPPIGPYPLPPSITSALMGFPSDWPFPEIKGQKKKQVGNAVPPPISKIIGDALYRRIYSGQ